MVIANTDSQINASDFTLELPQSKSGTYKRFYETRDLDDFSKFAERIKNRLIPFFRKLGADYQKAEDLVQETLIKLFNGVDKFDAVKNENGYIYAVARYTHVDSKRKQSTLKRNGTVSFFSTFQSEEGRAFDIAEESIETPINRLVKLENIEILKAYLNSLSSANRDVVVATYLEENSRKDAAKKLGTTISALSTRLSRVIKQIREKLKF